MIKSSVIFFALLATSFGLKAQESSTSSTVEFDNPYSFSAEIAQRLAQDTVPWKHQIAASDYASKGDYQNALLQWDLAIGGRDINYSATQIDSVQQQYQPVNAVDYITTLAQEHQIVIINEAHHNSSHRVFTRSLLKKLYAAGYTQLGLEALSYTSSIDSLQHIRKYPIQKTGYYTKDPQFGNMIRDAIAIGFTLFPYETQNRRAGGKAREIQQAQNIDSVMQRHPGEKFLIHCGFDHALEGEHSSWEKAMAGRLQEYTGIDPLTINQVQYSEKGNLGYSHPLLKAFDLSQPSILIDPSGNPLRYERNSSWSDLAVFHPPTTYKNGRPEWLFNQTYKETSLSFETTAISFPVMVLAYKKGEDNSIAVPVDITEVKNQNDTCLLSLKSGKYDIIVTDGANSKTFTTEVN